MADHITDEAVTVDSLIDLHARKLALIYANRTVGDHTFTGVLADFLAAALPVLDTAKDSETREAIAAEFERFADTWGSPIPSPSSYIAQALRARAASLRGEQG